MAQVFLGLGSNLGNREENIAKAYTAIAALPNTKLIKHSRNYKTDPVGHTDQPKFINAAAKIETTIEPLELLKKLKKTEKKLGRKETFKWGPRIIDIDILTYDNLKISTPELTIPHPEMDKRAFVLNPLKEIS